MSDNYSEVVEDVNWALGVASGENDLNHKRVYPNTNENLKALFENFSVKDKDVFTVAGSSDQIFNSFYKGAKSVDTFDINKLTFYYYYLRKWMINYLGEEYIKDEYYKDSSNLIKLVNSIKADREDEMKAQLFWIQYFTKVGRIDKGLFLVTSEDYKSEYGDDLETLKERIKNVKFYNYDMGERFVLNKKYDVIILSNILECLHNPTRLFAARNNIERLLNDDGICVCSHLMEGKDHPLHKAEIEIMTSNILTEEDFDDYYYLGNSNYKREVGYVYKKGVK